MKVLGLFRVSILTGTGSVVQRVGSGRTGQGHLVGFAGHKPLEGSHVLGKVKVDYFSRPLRQILEVGANSLGRVLLLQGADEAGLDIFPALLVDLEGVQTAPPGLGSASEDAGQLLYFSLVVPGGNVGGKP
jgi:hypothetical protein